MTPQRLWKSRDNWDQIKHQIRISLVLVCDQEGCFVYKTFFEINKARIAVLQRLLDIITHEPLQELSNGNFLSCLYYQLSK